MTQENIEKKTRMAVTRTLRSMPIGGTIYVKSEDLDEQCARVMSSRMYKSFGTKYAVHKKRKNDPEKKSEAGTKIEYDYAIERLS